MNSNFVKKLFPFLIIGFCLIGCTDTNNNPSSAPAMKEKEYTTLLYVGTYTKTEGHVDGQADRIYILELNNQTGALTPLDTIPNTINPSYLTVHPNGKYLYAVNEIATIRKQQCCPELPIFWYLRHLFLIIPYLCAYDNV